MIQCNETPGRTQAEVLEFMELAAASIERKINSPRRARHRPSHDRDETGRQ